MATEHHRDRVLRAGELEVHPTDGLVLAAGRAVMLSVRELELLTALVERAGAIVRREDLYEAVWGTAMRRGDRTIDVYVHKLRSKLEAALPASSFIHTHIGFGYRLEPTSSGASPSVHISKTSR